MKLRAFILCLCLMLLSSGFAYESREALRAAYSQVSDVSRESPYLKQPDPVPPCDVGALTEQALDDALNYLNFIRSVAGLEPVHRSILADLRCQHGAVLLAANDRVEHDAPKPEGLSDDFYLTAHEATLTSNIARFNWMRPTILRESIAFYVRDDGDNNLSTLGHRRWVLNPLMTETGFGLANSLSGMSYTAMYAHDMGNANCDWETVCWPAPGAFPVEFMQSDLAWSVTVNPELYTVSDLSVILTCELRDGTTLTYTFPAEKDYLTVNTDAYGAGPCIIFRPDPESVRVYEQNQVWTVEIRGLTDANGSPAPLVYSVEMTSLFPQPVVNLELAETELSLKVGETALLNCAVIPAYADDPSVEYTSDDASVAVVDIDGNVTAVAPGTCTIIVKSTNDITDRCTLTVTE
ncbi:MAG: Ig-like domain-containing protein [Clostridia bacterium]|nr:Ig-like domain-containing protein [Clostridia bacterium]